MNFPQKQLLEQRFPYSEEELKAVKKIFDNLLLACKNLAIYPPGHTISNNSIHQLHLQLRSFLQDNQILRFDIERELITYKEEAISEGIPREGTLHFALFQAGIRWLEFIAGIEPGELRNILMTLDKYTRLATEPEGDIVTAFWEAQFPHIRYEVAEFSWEDEQEAENEMLDLTGEQAFGMQVGDFEGQEPEISTDPAIDYDQIALTPQEKEELKEMISQEEETRLTAYLNALMDSLLLDLEKENFNFILETLSEEFIGCLTRKDFASGLIILEGLRTVFDICKGEAPWTMLSIDDFFLKASSPDSLASLKEAWVQLNEEEVVILGKIFKHLNPQAILTIGSLLLQTHQEPFREVLWDSITSLTSQDLRPLESLLNNSDEGLVEKLVPVIVNLPGEAPFKYLIRLTRHPSPQVRQEAVKGIFHRDPSKVKVLFNRIDDLDDFTRKLIFKQMAQSRDGKAEELLLTYLQHREFNKNEESHLLLCFKTLGRCGSARSIPFLQETLFQGRWMAGFRSSALQRGAATALLVMNLPEAEQVLKQADRFFLPGLSAVIRKIRKDIRTEEAEQVVE